MLNIIKNELVKNGRVLYIDENGNKVTIFAQTDGEDFKVKIRPASDITVEVLSFKRPYIIDGVHFSLSKKVSDDYKNEENNIVDDATKQFLEECTKLIERWINIELCLFQANAQNAKRLFSSIGNENFDSMVEYIVDAVQELRTYEEAKDIVKMYDAIIVDTQNQNRRN